MERIITDDHVALSELLQRHWNSLTSYATGILDASDAAEDIVQEAYIRLWQGRRTWITGGSVRGYLYTIVRNLCIHELDHRKVRQVWAVTQQGRPRFSPAPDEIYQSNETERAFQKAVSELPKRRREVFVLACLQGLTYAEVASIMGIAVPTVANQMTAALEHLREALQTITDERI